MSVDVQNAMKNKPKWIILCTILVLIISALLYAYFIVPPIFPSTHTELYKYKIIKNHWWQGSIGFVEHFPQKLPDDASAIHLYYEPPFLMGAGCFQLKIEYSDSQKIQQLYNKFYEERLCLYQKEKGFYDPKDPKAFFDLPDVFIHYYLSDDKMYDSAKYPSNFTIIFLKMNEAGGTGFRWNHGDISGVAINANDNTIVYFAEIW
jgi:hypothetical protein